MIYVVYRRTANGLKLDRDIPWSKHLGDMDRICWEHKLQPGDVLYINEYFRVLTHYDEGQLVRSQFEYLDELADKQFTFGGRPWSDEMGEFLLEGARGAGAPV
jgi:hypothetical protein